MSQQKYDAPTGAPPQYNNAGISSPAPAHTSPYNQPAPYQGDGYPPNVGQSPQPGYQQGYQQQNYGPPQGEYYGQQQQYQQQGYPPQQGYGFPQQGYQQQGGPQYGNQQGQFVSQDRGNKGAATGIFAACAGLMACCCCLDCIF